MQPSLQARPKSLISRDGLVELMEAVRACPRGDVVEVGVYKGGSALALDMVCREQGRKLWLFDTFEGMPWAGQMDAHPKGDFGDTSADAVRALLPDAQLIIGTFPKTLKDAQHLGLGQIAAAHVDCDQYRSVKACAELLGPLMLPGGLIVFDDYYSLQGARCAVDEVFGAGRVRMTRTMKAHVRFP